MTERPASLTQTLDLGLVNDLLEVHVTYVHKITDVDSAQAIIDKYKSWEGDPTLFNSASFIAEIVDLPDGGHQLMISSNSGVIQ